VIQICALGSFLVEWGKWTAEERHEYRTGVKRKEEG
jgi:hypothetical protein